MNMNRTSYADDVQVLDNHTRPGALVALRWCRVVISVLSMSDKIVHFLTRCVLVALQTPVEESVRGMVALLTAATAETLNGRFVDGNGSDMPW